MEFGKVQYIDNIDFTLPPDDPVTEQLWQRLAPAVREPLRIFVGGTEWGRASWVGRAYPRSAKPKDFLSYYARQFNTIELNTLFYGLQTPEVIRRWAAAVGDDFRFCPKFPEAISHKLQLANAGRETGAFVGALDNLGPKLGPSFLLLSDRFDPSQASRLQQYVRRLPSGFQACVELRNADWFGQCEAGETLRAPERSELIRDTWEVMMDAGVGTVITDVAGRRDVLHMRLTAPVAFIRLVTSGLHPTSGTRDTSRPRAKPANEDPTVLGPKFNNHLTVDGNALNFSQRIPAIDYQRADAWVERIRTWAARGLREVYLFVHSPGELTSPEMMKYLIEQFNEKGMASLPVPNLVNGGEPENLSLF
jgi:uncharacterized protein YecE (DUF72 family)